MVLAGIYLHSTGALKNYKAAEKWYAIAAVQGDANAQYNLGVMKDTGDGILENNQAALKWYTLAAAQGVALAQNALGVIHLQGDGVLKDINRGHMWLILSAYNGSDLGAKNRDAITKQMTPAGIAETQKMADRCLASNYTSC